MSRATQCGASGERALGACSQIGQSRRRRVDVDQYRLRDVATAALYHPHREPASLRRKGETQRRGCRNRLLPRTPPQDTPGAAFARGDREAAQHAVVVRPEPCERRTAFGRAQGLLKSPQLIGDAAAADHQQSREVEPRGRERRCIRQMCCKSNVLL